MLIEVAGPAMGVAALAFCVVAVVAIRQALRGRSDRLPQAVPVPVTGFGRLSAVIALALLGVGGTAAVMVLMARHGQGVAGLPPAATHTVAPARHTAMPDASPLLLTAAVFLLLAAAAVLLARVRHLPRSTAVPSPPPGRSHAQYGTARVQRPGTDTTRARIIGSYAALEAELARCRPRRGLSETPEELLQRVGADGANTTAARTLTELFAAARFSTRPVTAEDRERADRALAEARRQLFVRPSRWAGTMKESP
ncbi:DUF4129 domain-containing protein [Streptomyces sp. NPDC059118]|uniref:DUF4129 domain-containing protein n=1 Tax=unclassified Streptomyces TaxID=2593676 RepID=UPI0036C0EE7C